MSVQNDLHAHQFQLGGFTAFVAMESEWALTCSLMVTSTAQGGICLWGTQSLPVRQIGGQEFLLIRQC